MFLAERALGVIFYQYSASGINFDDPSNVVHYDIQFLTAHHIFRVHGACLMCSVSVEKGILTFLHFSNYSSFAPSSYYS